MCTSAIRFGIETRGFDVSKEIENVSLPSMMLSSFKTTLKHLGIVEFNVMSVVMSSKSRVDCADPEMVFTLQT